MEADLFHFCGHCWIFQICWQIECSTLAAASFRILSAGISSSPLALFIVMLPKAHLSSHSRISSSMWVTTQSWLSGSLRTFLYSSSVYSCHLVLISSASVRSLTFCPVLCPSLMKCSLGISSFLKEIFSLSCSIVSSYSLHCSHNKAFLSLFAILWNSSFI